MGVALGWRKVEEDDVDKDTDDIKGSFLGLVQRPPLGSCPQPEGKELGCQKGQLPEYYSQAPGLHLCDPDEGPEAPSLTHLTPKPHLKCSEDLTSSGIVPLVFLQAPGVGEEQVIF